MILDRLENLRLYSALNPYIGAVADFMAHNTLAGLPEGRTEICGSDCFVNIDTAHGKSRREALLETHDRMTDIQTVFHRTEVIGWKSRLLLPEAPYDSGRDITFHHGERPEEYITLRPGLFAMFLPGDAHAPCISAAGAYRKAVFKLRTE